ncbi:MAG: metallophosphoesterase [Ruminococcus sp.]|nr:metallophosphoesterase [Ruminococcus sp.]
MRLIVFSDTHGSLGAAREIVERNKDARTFIFLGDGEREIDKLRILYPELEILNVSGNCDYGSFTPNSNLYDMGSSRIFYTHGHRFSVKYGVDTLVTKAKEVGADIALFGHTHERYYKYIDGVHVLNPGSASCPRDGSKPSYAFIDITDGGIMCSHVEL